MSAFFQILLTFFQDLLSWVADNVAVPIDDAMTDFAKWLDRLLGTSREG